MNPNPITRLARELFEVGIAERDRNLSIDVRTDWNDLDRDVQRAWRAVARHILKTYVKKG